MPFKNPRNRLVLGVEGGASIILDPDLSSIQIFDANGDLVGDITPTTGFSHYDPQEGARARMITDIGQSVHSMHPGTEVGHTIQIGRIAAFLLGTAAANVRGDTEVRSPGVDSKDVAVLFLEGESADSTIESNALLIAGDIFLGNTLTTDVVVTGDNITLDGVATIAGDQITASRDGVNALAVTSGTNDTTSGTFVNMAGTGSQTSFAFTKRYTSTRVKIEFSFDAYCITSGADIEVAVSIDGTDYLIRKAVLVLNQHQSYTATAYLTGVTSGSKTIQARWRRVAGTGTARRDTNDWLSISAEEVD